MEASTFSNGHADLTGKTALVTGGSRGIGAATARRLAAAGANVAITYLNSEDAAHRVAREINQNGSEAEAFRVDAADAEAVSQLVPQVVKRFGGLDILVNNAGIFPQGTVTDTTDADFDTAVNTNLRPVYIASREAAKVMQDGGRIVNIGTVFVGRVGLPGLSLYTMTKAAVSGLTKAWARDLGEQGVTVNAVHPGPINTDMNPSDSEFAENVLTPQTALGRYGEPEEIASTVAFLASDEGSYITGADLYADGGMSA